MSYIFKSIKAFLLASLCFLTATSFSQWTVENIAGTGESGFSPGIAPLENGFATPGAIAKDTEGNIYFGAVDIFSAANSGIYKLSADYSTLEFLVPNASSVTGLAVDSDGNLYFSMGAGLDDDYNFEYIYIKPASGDPIVPFAGLETDGHPAEGADALGTPIGNAGSLKIFQVGGVEYLYYCATLEDNNFIQKINLSTGKTFRVAGSPHTLDADTYVEYDNGADAMTSQISLALGLAQDSEGNIYFSTAFADADDDLLDGRYQIKKIVAGKIFHVAGIGEAGYSGDEDVAANAAIKKVDGGFEIIANELYFGDGLNRVIRKIELSTTSDPDLNITTICGTGSSDALNPTGKVENGQYKPALDANVLPADIMATDNGIIITDGDLLIRRFFDCEHPTVDDASITISKEVICNGDEVVIKNSAELKDATEWIWYNESGCNVETGKLITADSVIVTANTSTTYYVIASGGCVVDATCTPIALEVNCSNYFNTFTPNGDGTNDFFEIPVLDGYPINRVTIYNRWGDLLEQIDNYNNIDQVWRGTNGGTDPVDSGTYYFTAISDDVVIVSGWIQLIK